jgi:cytoskeleton protein RodZ
MDEDGAAPDAAENAEFAFQSVGEKLLAARTEKALSLSEVAAQTRIPIRHLEALEASDFAALPGSTYSLGFAKSYARFVGLDPTVIADELRAELAQSGHAGFVPATPDYEPADPGRVPPRWMAWTAAAVALVAIIGYLAWRSFALSPSSAPMAVTETNIAPAKSAQAAAAGATTAPPTGGAVVITADDTVWVKIYDADEKRLFESEMKAGDSYTVPADANGPMIVTGRPQHLKVTVGGKPVPALGEADRTVSDVGVSAAALLARKAPDASAEQNGATGANAAPTSASSGENSR